jgi:hypothetical protein
MVFSEKQAIRYALGRIQTVLYPKRYPYEDIIKLGKFDANDYSADTIKKLKSIGELVDKESAGLFNQEYAYARLLIRDINNVIEYLSNNSLNFSGIVERLNKYAVEVAVPKIREKLEMGYQPPPINIVDVMPGMSGGGGFGADRWQSEKYGMPEGIFIHKNSLNENSEVLLLHELTHPAVETFPNFVPWFDEGICNFIAFWIYSEETGNLEFRQSMKYRAEFGDYYLNPGRLFRRPDYMFCSLLLIGGMDLVKILIRYKQKEPEKVRWDVIPSLLQMGVPLEEFVNKVFLDDINISESNLTPTQRRIVSTVLSHNISHVLTPMAWIVFEKILQRRPYPCRWKKEELVDDKYTSLSIEKVVEELKQRYLIWVFPTGDFEPYMGPYIGTNHFYNAGLLKAWSRVYECKKW